MNTEKEFPITVALSTSFVFSVVSKVFLQHAMLKMEWKLYNLQSIVKVHQMETWSETEKEKEFYFVIICKLLSSRWPKWFGFSTLMNESVYQWQNNEKPLRQFISHHLIKLMLFRAFNYEILSISTNFLSTSRVHLIPSDRN